MDYAELIDALLADETTDAEVREVAAKAKAYDDQGIIAPTSYRTYLRKAWEARTPATCDLITQGGVCVYLSEKKPPGFVVKCPFYPRGDDPRECHSYRPQPAHSPKRPGSIVLYGDMT